MTGLWLIAAREFRAYVATASFWAALLLGPLLVGGGMALISAPPRTTPIATTSGDPALRAGLTATVLEAARIEGRRLVVTPDADATAHASLTAAGEMEVAFSRDFPLSPSGRALAARTLQLNHLGPAGLRSADTVVVHEEPASSDRPSEGMGRFAVVMILWLTLAGSLGMLLQAVVRERSNRSLELLLASVSAWPLVLGKLIGVGLVSLLVLTTWLAPIGFAAFTPAATRLAPLLAATSEPAALARALAVYVLGFGFYGLATVAIGASARDNAAAQNLARPMFATLLAAFFVAMASAGGAAPNPWLTYLPPLTPFLMLMQPAAAEDALRLGILAVSAAMMGLWAVGQMQVAPPPSPIARLRARFAAPAGN